MGRCRRPTRRRRHVTDISGSPTAISPFSPSHDAPHFQYLPRSEIRDVTPTCLEASSREEHVAHCHRARSHPPSSAPPSSSARHRNGPLTSKVMPPLLCPVVPRCELKYSLRPSGLNAGP